MIDFETALAYLFDCPTMPHALDVFEAARAALRCDGRPAVRAQALAVNSAVAQVISAP
jgi:hypothetical protein